MVLDGIMIDACRDSRYSVKNQIRFEGKQCASRWSSPKSIATFMALNTRRSPKDVCELLLVEGLWGKRSDTLPLSEYRVEREHRLELWGRE
jgi:hypothetical protein